MYQDFGLLCFSRDARAVYKAGEPCTFSLSTTLATYPLMLISEFLPKPSGVLDERGPRVRVDHRATKEGPLVVENSVVLSARVCSDRRGGAEGA